MNWNLLKYKWARRMFWNSIKRLMIWAVLAWLGLFWIIDLPGWTLDFIFPTIVVIGILLGFIFKKILKFKV